MRKILLAASVLALAGCTFGIGGNSPSDTFNAAVAYQDAYQTAVQQAKLCLRGDDAYDVVSELNAAGKSGVVRVVAPFTSNDIARVDIQAIDERSSKVHVVMWGPSIWNRDAVRAMRDAIYYGIPSCSAYMPLDVKPGKK